MEVAEGVCGGGGAALWSGNAMGFRRVLRVLAFIFSFALSLFGVTLSFRRFFFGDFLFLLFEVGDSFYLLL